MGNICLLLGVASERCNLTWILFSRLPSTVKKINKLKLKKQIKQDACFEL